jgi:eukaryotic-like serine/threonine-protein kinase
MCPDQETLQSFVTRRLAPEGGGDVQGHLADCPDCKGLVERLRSGLSSSGTMTGDLSISAEAASAATAAVANSLAEGQKVRRYIILRSLAKGGMGVVYAAYDTALDRKIALKFLTRAGGDRRLMEGLLAEASAMAKLSHPNVVAIHDVGVYAGAPYMAMDFVDGMTLAEWGRIQARTPGEVATVMAATARGLAAAHTAGIVHRDVKPQNILVAGTRVQVTDFGVSVHAANPINQDEVVGTPGYMAPEQLYGGPVDHRTDIFGFCATLYEMLHGVRPFPIVSVGGYSLQRGTSLPETPPKGSRVPGWLHRLALQGMAPDPADRPSSMTAVADALLADPGRRRRRALLASAGAIALLAAFGGGTYLAASPERRCQLGAAAIDGDWSDSARVQIRRLFERAGQVPAWTIAERHLTRYAGRWRETYRENCTATFGDRRQSSDVFDLRMACLAGRRVALRSFVAALPSVPAQKLAGIATTAAVLPDLAHCDASARPGLRALPADPQQRQQIAAVEATIEETVVKAMLGDYAGAARLAAGAVATGRKLGYEPVLARALAMASNVERRRGGVDQSAGQAVTAVDRSMQMLEEALVLADRGHDDRMRASAAREMVSSEMMRGRLQEAEMWAKRSSAILSRLGNPPQEVASLMASLGWLKLERGQRKEAAEAFNRSIELRKTVLPADDPEQVGPRAGACESRERRDDRNRCYRELLPFARSVYGPDHDDVGIIMMNLASDLVEDPRTRDEACDLFRQVLRLSERNVEPSNQGRLMAMDNLAYCLATQRKHLGEARRLYEQALARAQAPSLVVERASLHSNFAELLADAGERQRALALARAALAERKTAFGETHPYFLKSWALVADILASGGNPGQALRELDRGIAAGQRASTPSPVLARLFDQRGLLLTQAWKRFRDARRDHQAALAIHDRLQTPEAERHGTFYGLGLAELGLQLARPALTHLQRAHQVRAEGGVSPEMRADSAFALGQALARAGQPRDRACELAREALAPYREAGPKRRSQLQQLESWLDRQSCGATGKRAVRTSPSG